jgi:prepilin-type processing-associated H-X9-DG protein
MKRFCIVIASLFLLFCTAAHAAEKYDPAGLAKTIEPYLDDATLFVVHVDMTRADPAPLAARIKAMFQAAGFPQVGNDELARFDQEVDGARNWVADFTRAGGRDYFVVVSMSGFPEFPIYVVVPLKPGADSQAIIKLMAVKGPQEFGVAGEVHGDVILWGRKATRESLKMLKAQPRASLVKAFEAAGDSAAQALFVPSEQTRKVLVEMFPNPSAGPLQGATDPISKGIMWAAFGADIAPEPKLNIVIQSPDASSATALAETLNKLIALGKQMLAQEIRNVPQSQKLIGDVDALAEGFTPAVEGDRLTFHLDTDQSLKLAGLELPAFAQARGRASQAVAASNMKQILLGCVMYAEDHKGAFPADFQALMKTQPAMMPQLFKHPMMPEKEIGYVYVRPTKAAPAQQVVVYEAWDVPPARLMVGFADGHVEQMDYPRFEKVLEQSKARNAQQ